MKHVHPLFVVAVCILLLPVRGACWSYASVETTIFDAADSIDWYQLVDGSTTAPGGGDRTRPDNSDDNGFAYRALEAGFPGTYNWFETPSTHRSTYGSTGRGLVWAALRTGDPAFIESANRVADGIITKVAPSLGGYLHASDIIFAYELRAVGGTDITGAAAAAATLYIAAQGGDAEGVHDAYWASANAGSIARALVPINLARWAHIGALMGDWTFATEMADLVAADYGTEWDPSTSPPYVEFGLAGTVLAQYYAYGGTHEDAEDEIVVRLGTTDTRDVQSWASFAAALGAVDNAYKGITADVLQSTFNTLHNVWFHGDGYFYPNMNAAAIYGLALVARPELWVASIEPAPGDQVTIGFATLGGSFAAYELERRPDRFSDWQSDTGAVLDPVGMTFTTVAIPGWRTGFFRVAGRGPSAAEAADCRMKSARTRVKYRSKV